MKTEKEIKNAKDSLEKELELYNLCGMLGMYYTEKSIKLKILKRILENHVPKRTIFDLTKKELQELINMVNPLENNKIQFIKKEKKYVYIVTESTCFSIYDDLDIFLHNQSDSHAPRNQVKYIDRIREMLQEA